MFCQQFVSLKWKSGSLEIFSKQEPTLGEFLIHLALQSLLLWRFFQSEIIQKMLIGTTNLKDEHKQKNCEQIKCSILEERQKLLPKGTCLPELFKKYQYVSKFLEEPKCHLYILPSNLKFAKFMIVKTVSKVDEKPIIRLYYHPKKKCILSARKQSNNIGCNYIISSDQQPNKNQFFVGKLRGNFGGNEFNIYDDGENPNKNPSKPRKQLAFIQVLQKSVWSSNNEQENITMIAPKPQQNLCEGKQIQKYIPLSFSPKSNNQNLLLNEYKQNSMKIQVLQNVKQKNSAQSNSPRSKRVDIALQINTKLQILSIQKKTSTTYEMFVGGPLTLLQGFGFFLAMMENKQN